MIRHLPPSPLTSGRSLLTRPGSLDRSGLYRPARGSTHRSAPLTARDRIEPAPTLVEQLPALEEHLPARVEQLPALAEQLPALAERKASPRLADCPPAFVARLTQTLGGADAARVLAQLRRPPQVGVRLNPLRIDVTDAAAVTALLDALADGITGASAHGFADGASNRPADGSDGQSVLCAISGLAGCYAAASAARAAITAGQPVRDGLAWLQNPSSLLPVLALDPQPGEEVLDLAAAPGMKTLHIAALMADRGRIAAVESVKPRFFKLREVLRGGGATIVQTYLADGRSIGRKTPGRFDRVLLDAPCSSEARFLRDVPATMAHWTQRKVRDCARKQRGLLSSAFAALKPGGTLVYSTCSFAVEENEEVIAWLLARAGGAAQVMPWSAPAGECRPGVTASCDAAWQRQLERCVRVLPDGLFGGFFIAVIAKASTSG